MEALIFSFLFWASPNFVLGASAVDVTYQELQELDATCNNLDNCRLPRLLDSLMRYTCHCDSHCSQLDTCCVDSPYRGQPVRGPKPSCKTLYGRDGSDYFMVDRCPSGGNVENAIENLCRSEWDGEGLMPLMPVTSLSTNVTYKNYFCFRCNEVGDEYRYWNVRLSADIQSNERHVNAVPSYDKDNHIWVAPIGKRGVSVPVTLSIEIPDDIWTLPRLCQLNVISTCSQRWQDDTQRHKCNAYTSFVYFHKTGRTTKYKNPHCALCNSEDLEKMLCSIITTPRTTMKKPFTFSYLLDVNRADGDKVGKIKRCDDSAIWDPYFRKCRAIKCALPGYVLRNGECSAP